MSLARADGAAIRTSDAPPESVERRAQLGRRTRLLAGASVAHVGFGLDSVVEVSSGLIVAPAGPARDEAACSGGCAHDCADGCCGGTGTRSAETLMLTTRREAS